MNTHQRERGRVRLYACGGGGINIGHKLEQFCLESNSTFAQLDVAYIDTAKSNLSARIASDNTYLIEGLDGEEIDGSGQERTENHEPIAARVPDILLKYKPADLNIVLGTLSGGSGSVIAPSITSELLGRGESVIVIGIGDDSTRKFTKNTLGTLRSYATIAQIRQQPVVMSYVQNSIEMTRGVIDARVQNLVSALCVLFSRQNRELDSKDLFKWLHYQEITSYQPGLSALTLIETLNPASLSKIGNLISIATLTNPASDPTLPIRPEVQFVGYLDEGGAQHLGLGSPFHYVISDGVFGEVESDLNSVLKELNEQGAARVKRSGIAVNTNEATSTGLVFD